LTAPADEALKLQRPLPDRALKIVATGVKKDGEPALIYAPGWRYEFARSSCNRRRRDRVAVKVFTEARHRDGHRMAAGEPGNVAISRRTTVLLVYRSATAQSAGGSAEARPASRGASRVRETAVSRIGIGRLHAALAVLIMC
jgi:hypothetical protein